MVLHDVFVSDVTRRVSWLCTRDTNAKARWVCVSYFALLTTWRCFAYPRNMSGEQPTQGQPTEQGEQLPKVTVHGRIGQVYDAEYLPQRDNQMVFKFSVAEHPSADETVWYKVTTFGERAQAMVKRFEEGELKVGQAVSVVGRLKVSEYVSRRTGQPGVDRQIYPFSVKPDAPQQPAQPQQPPTPQG